MWWNVEEKLITHGRKCLGLSWFAEKKKIVLFSRFRKMWLSHNHVYVWLRKEIVEKVVVKRTFPGIEKLEFVYMLNGLLIMFRIHLRKIS